MLLLFGLTSGYFVRHQPTHPRLLSLAMMGGGVKQPRPRAGHTFDPLQHPSAAAALPAGAHGRTLLSWSTARLYESALPSSYVANMWATMPYDGKYALTHLASRVASTRASCSVPCALL